MVTAIIDIIDLATYYFFERFGMLLFPVFILTGVLIILIMIYRK